MPETTEALALSILRKFAEGYVDDWRVETGESAWIEATTRDLTNEEQELFRNIKDNPSEYELTETETDQVAAFIDSTRWTAQTIHQAYHVDTRFAVEYDGGWRSCPKSVCRAAITLLDGLSK